MEFAKNVFNLLNRILPWAKRLVPFAVKKNVIRKVFSSRQEFEALPHRKWIFDVLLMRLAEADPERIVFVGTAPYTFYYEKAFDVGKTDYVTIDPAPAAQVWGAEHHVVDFVENVGRYLPAHSVDALLFIGVYGFGPKTAEELRQVLMAIHKILKPSGLLVFSWNSDISDDPIEHPDFRRLFCHEDVLGMPARKSFDTLVIDLHVAI